ncbi:DUF2087 domain-containing protein [Lysinibacillus sp. RS5]
MLLQHIVTKFEVGRKYSDYVSIRRYLIEYGFLDRSDDCTTYWVKEA